MSSCAAQTGLVAMDCVVVCCCCPCLVLQVTVFLFIRLPKKVVVKSKRIILSKWLQRRAKKGRAMAANRELEGLHDDDGFEGAFGGHCCYVNGDYHQGLFAMENEEEEERVWEEIVEREGFVWFGSFWGRPIQEDPTSVEGEMYAGLSLPVLLERL